MINTDEVDIKTCTKTKTATNTEEKTTTRTNKHISIDTKTETRTEICVNKDIDKYISKSGISSKTQHIQGQIQRQSQR